MVSRSRKYSQGKGTSRKLLFIGNLRHDCNEGEVIGSNRAHDFVRRIARKLLSGKGRSAIWIASRGLVCLALSAGFFAGLADAETVCRLDAE
jgi:hypothetical protein